MVADLCVTLATRHPNRSVNAIRQCRTKNRSYRDALAEVRLERLRAANQEALITEETGRMPEPGHASLSENPVLNAQHCNILIEWLNGKVTHNIGEFLEQKDSPNSVDQVQNALFPAKAAMVHHKQGNAPVTPEGISSQVYKCRCYARLQRSYKTDSSKTARDVLDDTWRGSSIKVTLEECLPFWRELLKRERALRQWSALLLRLYMRSCGRTLQRPRSQAHLRAYQAPPDLIDYHGGK